MKNSTREQFIHAAQRLFAERGFYGVSIAAVADELGLTKQALLHHFGSKEQLYAEVLQQLSAALLARTREIVARATEPAVRLEELVVAQYRGQMSDQHAARLIMRELLDNEQRAARAGNWYLKPYLDLLVDTALQIEVLRGIGAERALAVIYSFLGAAHYFAVSQPTLRRMYGAGAFDATRDAYEEELRTLIRLRLSG